MGINDLIKIGSRMKEIRNQVGLTQQNVADEIGVKVSTYSNYENDNREPSAETVKKISKVLGVSPFQLIGAKYFDKIYPEIAQGVKEYEGFIDYLKALDYEIKEVPEVSIIPYEKVPEELKNECDEKGCLDGESYSLVISKKGSKVKIILEELAFQQFQETIKKAIEFELFQLKQK